jgi:hypothetical protein
MLSGVVSGTSVSIGYSPSLVNSCVSATFWTAHEILSKQAHPRVSYCVTVPTPEIVFTTPVEFYVCEGLEPYDIVLGQDFDICCQTPLTGRLMYHTYVIR